MVNTYGRLVNAFVKVKAVSDQFVATSMVHASIWSVQADLSVSTTKILISSVGGLLAHVASHASRQIEISNHPVVIFLITGIG